ncbi:hypothetical protein CAPTEDRAFT_192019 [Capitella teleta]|uniref:Uncharacterized protein n=1 Tax=Capitella teleta TaxID=283909 RepID=R7TGD6_CAPTE|nr:hypothetical protein CAPTEDRAFT_192019 [Capitella teleta]|eukprot:ELT90631.1 hypothetical protein CAPTEDRAFT_192019 [Capitella teleta]
MSNVLSKSLYSANDHFVDDPAMNILVLFYDILDLKDQHHKATEEYQAARDKLTSHIFRMGDDTVDRKQMNVITRLQKELVSQKTNRESIRKQHNQLRLQLIAVERMLVGFGMPPPKKGFPVGRMIPPPVCSCRAPRGH